MFIARRLVPGSQKVELWECEWENEEGMQARKAYRRKIGEEQPALPAPELAEQRHAICWSYGRTLDNIAVLSPSLIGHFSDAAGADASLPCDFVNAGKYRHGADRWFCRTHQTHWGTKADQTSYAKSRTMVCANHTQQMHYVVSPLEVDVTQYAEVEVYCSPPPALSTRDIQAGPPRIRVRLTREAGGVPVLETERDAIVLLHPGDANLFANREITRVNVTPPAAFEFMCSLETGRQIDCVACSHCGYPHLDLGDFARKPHRKHSCANCGRDSTWTRRPIVSTPLKPLYDRLVRNPRCEHATEALNLEELEGCEYSVWASTPALIWTPDRVQRTGIRVRASRGGAHIVDRVFGEVTLRGKRLVREELFAAMLAVTTT